RKVLFRPCWPFYALGAYFGVYSGGCYLSVGARLAFFIVPLVVAGLLISVTGMIVERGLLSFVYERDETIQLLLTFAVVLMMEDLIRLTWGTAPVSTSGLYLIYGQTRVAGAAVPVYNLIVIAASLVIAAAIG